MIFKSILQQLIEDDSQEHKWINHSECLEHSSKYYHEKSKSKSKSNCHKFVFVVKDNIV